MKDSKDETHLKLVLVLGRGRRRVVGAKRSSTHIAVEFGTQQTTREGLVASRRSVERWNEAFGLFIEFRIVEARGEMEWLFWSSHVMKLNIHSLKIGG